MEEESQSKGKFRLCWKHSNKSDAGNGPYIFDEATAQSHVAELRSKFPHMTHWIEKETAR